jgi:hypothetical protein
MTGVPALAVCDEPQDAGEHRTADRAGAASVSEPHGASPVHDPMHEQSSDPGAAGMIGARDLPEEDGLAIADGQEPSPSR